MTEQTQRVLIVEQDRVEAGILAFHLRHAGFKPLLVSNDEEARDAASWAAPHAIICELGGERIDGLQFARDLRGTATTFFLVTDRALSASEDLDALRLGVAQVFTKPLEPEHLTAALQRPARGRLLGSLGQDLPPDEIAGTFESVSAVDLGRLWTRHRLDAKLRVLPANAPLDAPPTGELLVREGTVIAARYGEQEGRDAAVAALGDAHGTFVLQLLTPDAPALRRRDEVNADLASLLTYHVTSPGHVLETGTAANDAPRAAPRAAGPRGAMELGEPAPARLPPLPETRAAHATGAEDGRLAQGRGEFRIPPPLRGPGEDGVAGRPRSRARRQTPTKPRKGTRPQARAGDDKRATQPSPESPLRPTEVGTPEPTPSTAEYPVVRLRRGRRPTQPGISGIAGAPTARGDAAEDPAPPTTVERPTRRVRRRDGATMTPTGGLAPTTKPGLGSHDATDDARAAPTGGARVVPVGRGPRRPITQPGRPIRPADLERSRRVDLGHAANTNAPADDDEELGFAPDAPVEVTSSGVSERLSRRPRRFPGPPQLRHPTAAPHGAAGAEEPGGAGPETATPGLRAPALARTEDLATARAARRRDELVDRRPEPARSAADETPSEGADEVVGPEVTAGFESTSGSGEGEGEAAAEGHHAPDSSEDEAAPGDEDEAAPGDEGEAAAETDRDEGEATAEGHYDPDSGEDEGADRGAEPGEDGRNDQGSDGSERSVDEGPGASAGSGAAQSWETSLAARKQEGALGAAQEAHVFAPGNRPKRRLRRTADEPARAADDVRAAPTTETARQAAARPVTRVDLFDVADDHPQETGDAAGPGAQTGRGRTVAIVVLAALWLALVAFIAVRLATQPPALPAGAGPGAPSATPPGANERATDPVDAAYEEALHQAEAGEADRAIAGLRGVLERRPAHQPARARLATLLFDSDRYNEALPLFRRLAGEHPDDPGVLWHLGHIYRALGDSEQARAAWTRYLSVAPPQAPERAAIERLVRAAEGAR